MNMSIEAGLSLITSESCTSNFLESCWVSVEIISDIHIKRVGLSAGFEKKFLVLVALTCRHQVSKICPGPQKSKYFSKSVGVLLQVLDSKSYQIQFGKCKFSL